MTGRVFTKLFFSFVLVLSIGTAALDFTLRRFMEHSLPGDIALLRRDLLLASLFAMGLAIVLSAFLAQRAAARLDRIVTFANRIAAGDFSARVEEGNLDEISDVAHALDTTAARLEASFRALESRQRELAALLDSMQEAVVAVDSAGRIAWSNAVMQRIAPGAERQGQALVSALRDPEVLACIEAALRRGEPSSGKATSTLRPPPAAEPSPSSTM
jgi:two-component system phosphate regulon sensor histidine kinase PhoR